MSDVYSHWSASPMTFSRDHQYKFERDYFKPNGLWFDVDADWKRWCEGESFRVDGFAFRHIIELENDGILRLEDARDIDAFTRKYGRQPEQSYRSIEIDWKHLRSQFRGIVIAPYCWERRMTEHTMWYYSWDCASGCVWDLTAVKSVECVPQSQEVSQ